MLSLNTGASNTIVVMYFQTRSRLDRDLPRGLHPRVFLKGTAGALGDGTLTA